MIALAMLVSLPAFLTGCGGTKVYQTNKTVVYRGTIYNITDVKQINSIVEGTLANGETINLKGVERKRFESLVDEHGSIRVRMVFDFDEQDLVYRSAPVDSWKDFSRMQRSFESAANKIAKLMEDRKDTQVELK
jgi:hypothetical protein